MLLARNPDEEIIRPGVVGTQNIFKASAKAGVQRLVYTSSVAAVGVSFDPDTVLDESSWNDDTKYPYFLEKSISEREALQLSERYGIPTVRILPCTVLGPYDYRITPSTKNIADLVNGKTTTFKGGMNYVDVRDVAEAHAAAIDKGEPGGRYLVGSDNVTYADAGRLIKKITGVKPLHVNSTGVTIFLSGLIEFGAKLTGSDPLVTREMAREFVGPYAYYDCSLANEAFELTPRPTEEVLTDCIRWLLYVGKIKPKLAGRLADSLPPDPEW